MAFRGNFAHTLDPKNRLTIPAKLRDRLGSEVVIGKAIDNCGTIWTPEGFDAYTDRFLRDLHPLSQEAIDLNTQFSGNSFECDIDKTGRVMLRADILEHAGIERDLVVVGVHDHIELWNPDAWDERNAAIAANLKATVAKIVSAG